MSDHHHHRNSETQCQIYIGGLENNCKKEELKETFMQYGNIRCIWISRNSPRFAFIEYEHASDAKAAIRNLNGTYFRGTQIQVTPRRRSSVFERSSSKAKGGPICYPAGSEGRSAQISGGVPQKNRCNPEPHSRSGKLHAAKEIKCKMSRTMRQNVQQLLDSHPDGIYLTNFERLYNKQFGCINIYDMGYSIMSEFILDHSAVFHCLRLEDNDDFIIFDAKKEIPDKYKIKKRNKRIPPDVYENLKQLLLSKKTTGLASTEIQELYQQKYGGELNLQELGFESVNELLVASMDSCYLRQVRNKIRAYPNTLDQNSRSDSLEDHFHIPEAFQSPFPSECCDDNCKILPQKIEEGDTYLSVDGNKLFIKICLSEIYTPNKFFFHLLSKKADLEFMEEDLDEFYNQEHKNYIMPDVVIKKGLICAAKYSGDKKWHRAEVISVRNLPQVKVLYFDYGTVEEVQYSILRFLHKDFEKLSRQAIQGQLFNLKPVQGEKWDALGIQLFSKLTNNIDLVADVAEIIPKDDQIKISMALFDTNHEDDIFINEVLIDKGYARLKESRTTEEPVLSDTANHVNNLRLPNGTKELSSALSANNLSSSNMEHQLAYFQETREEPQQSINPVNSEDTSIHQKCINIVNFDEETTTIAKPWTSDNQIQQENSSACVQSVVLNKEPQRTNAKDFKTEVTTIAQHLVSEIQNQQAATNQGTEKSVKTMLKKEISAVSKMIVDKICCELESIEDEIPSNSSGGSSHGPSMNHISSASSPAADGCATPLNLVRADPPISNNESPQWSPAYLSPNQPTSNLPRSASAPDPFQLNLLQPGLPPLGPPIYPNFQVPNSVPYLNSAVPNQSYINPYLSQSPYPNVILPHMNHPLPQSYWYPAQDLTGLNSPINTQNVGYSYSPAALECVTTSSYSTGSEQEISHATPESSAHAGTSLAEVNHSQSSQTKILSVSGSQPSQDVEDLYKLVHNEALLQRLVKEVALKLKQSSTATTECQESVDDEQIELHETFVAESLSAADTASLPDNFNDSNLLHKTFPQKQSKTEEKTAEQTKQVSISESNTVSNMSAEEVKDPQTDRISSSNGKYQKNTKRKTFPKKLLSLFKNSNKSRSSCGNESQAKAPFIPDSKMSDQNCIANPLPVSNEALIRLPERSATFCDKNKREDPNLSEDSPQVKVNRNLPAEKSAITDKKSSNIPKEETDRLPNKVDPTCEKSVSNGGRGFKKGVSRFLRFLRVF